MKKLKIIVTYEAELSDYEEINFNDPAFALAKSMFKREEGVEISNMNGVLVLKKMVNLETIYL